MSMTVSVLAKKYLPDIILTLLGLLFGSSDSVSIELGKFGELPAIPFIIGVLVVMYAIYVFREELLISLCIFVSFIGIIVMFVHLW